MKNDKTPCNDELSKERYELFGDDVKIPSLASNKEELNTSEKQAVMKLILKKDRGKKFIKNWRPISLLNTDLKLI